MVRVRLATTRRVVLRVNGIYRIEFGFSCSKMSGTIEKPLEDILDDASIKKKDIFVGNSILRINFFPILKNKDAF